MAHLVVECHPESRRGELPVRFGSPGCMRGVAEVLDCWHGDGHRDFRVRGDDGALYILRHDLRVDRWQIHFFRRERAGD